MAQEVFGHDLAHEREHVVGGKGSITQMDQGVPSMPAERSQTNIPSKNTHHGGGRRLDPHQATSKSQRWRVHIITARGKKRQKWNYLQQQPPHHYHHLPPKLFMLIIRLQSEANQNISWKGLFYGNRKFHLSQSSAREGASFEVGAGAAAEEMAHSEG